MAAPSITGVVTQSYKLNTPGTVTICGTALANPTNASLTDPRDKYRWINLSPGSGSTDTHLILIGTPGPTSIVNPPAPQPIEPDALPGAGGGDGVVIVVTTGGGQSNGFPTPMTYTT